MADRVVIVNPFFEDVAAERAVLRDVADVEVARVDDRASLREALAGASAVVNPPYAFTFDLFEELPALEVVSVMGVGVDHVDLEAAAAHGVHVVHVPDYCVEEVATHALTLLLAAARRIPLYHDQVQREDWDWRAGRPVQRLSGRTLGLVGCGRIARRLAGLVEGLDLSVIAFDPYVDEPPAGVELVSFDELLDRSTLVSVHAPLTEETENLFDAAAFDAMAEGSVLVNTSRGAIVEEAAMVEALDDGTLLAAGLDVFREEPATDSPLLGRDDVVTTPHVAWYSEDSAEALRRRAAEDVRRVLEGEPPANPVS